MMRKLLMNALIVIGFTLALITGLMAQTEDMETKFKIGATTKGQEIYTLMGNGRAWQKLDMQSRITYLTGIAEGLDLAKREGLKWDYLYEPTGFLFSEIAKQIDRFYSDSANLRIPIVEAYIYTKRKIKGDSPKELADFEALLRKTYNK